ncbi:MAG: HlyC/CorC family transporter [Lachnospiraceae bacterium]|nr:HlyC/CorC family transporter [Lachnospiraceae bacterium]
MSTSQLLQLASLIVLLFLSGFFSGAETALTTVNLIRIRGLADDGNRRAKTILYITDRRAKMLSTILIGNNIVNIAATSLTTVLAISLFGDSSVGIVSGILTLLVLIFGEITPKNMAAANAERIALRDAGAIRLLMTVLTPVIFVVDTISRMLLLLRGVDPDARPVMTENELRTLVNVSEEEGVIESDESHMISNVVDLVGTRAEEIMIPRIDMQEVPYDISYDGLIEFFREHRYTRLPVYKDRNDNIIGIIDVKSILLVDRENFRLTDHIKEPYYTYEKKNISDLLDEMREKASSVAIVLDEYGSASGMLTMEDVLEEIVGDIRDDYRSRDLEEITEIVPGLEYTCRGSMDIDDFNEATGLTIQSEDYDSVGGYIIERSGDALPEVGDYVTTEDGSKLIVEAIRQHRILRVHVYLASGEDAS